MGTSFTHLTIEDVHGYHGHEAARLVHLPNPMRQQRILCEAAQVTIIKDSLGMLEVRMNAIVFASITVWYYTEWLGDLIFGLCHGGAVEDHIEGEQHLATTARGARAREREGGVVCVCVCACVCVGDKRGKGGEKEGGREGGR